MPVKIRISARAETDLLRIAEYIAFDNPDAAIKHHDLLLQKFELLGDFPELGRARNDVGGGLRSFPVGRYVIIYRTMRNGVDIVRVVHGAREVSDWLTGHS